MKSASALLILALCLSACADDRDCLTDGTYDIPEVTVRCTSDDQADECHDVTPPTVDQKFTWTIIMPKGQDCSSFEFTDDYYAKSETQITCTGAVCSTVAGDWTNKNGDSVTELDGGTYRFCAWIDTNNDNAIKDDPNEPRTVSDQPIDSCGRAIPLNGLFEF